MAIAADARLSPSAARQRLTDGDAGILDRVVVVDMQDRPWRAPSCRSANARDSWSSMWSKKPTPVWLSCRPVPSRFSVTSISVSAVLRVIVALRMRPSCGCLGW
jgi:hypothetical protein